MKSISVNVLSTSNFNHNCYTSDVYWLLFYNLTRVCIIIWRFVLEFLLVILFGNINQELSLLLNFIKEFLLISKFLTSPNLSTGNYDISDEFIQLKTFKNKYQSSFNKKLLVSLWQAWQVLFYLVQWISLINMYSSLHYYHRFIT